MKNVGWTMVLCVLTCLTCSADALTSSVRSALDAYTNSVRRTAVRVETIRNVGVANIQGEAYRALCCMISNDVEAIFRQMPEITTNAAERLVLMSTAWQGDENGYLDAYDGTAVNNAQVEFGCDADGDGSLSANERELTVGWDCGAWFVRDARAGTTVRVLAESGRRKLEWTLSLGAGRKGRSLRSNVFSVLPAATLFNPDWNLARVVIRGKDAADALVRSRIRVNPLVLRIR